MELASNAYINQSIFFKPLMQSANHFTSGKTVLVVEAAILVRLVIAEYLRGCGLRVVEAASGLEAKMVLQKGPAIDVLFADARVAGEDNGFELAQWTRRYRPSIEIVLTSSLANKSTAAATLCGRHHPSPKPASHLRARLQAMRPRQASAVTNGPGRTGKSRAS